MFFFSFRLVEIAKMTEVLSGESVRDHFQGFLKKHSLDSCISIKLGENGGLSLNMVAESNEVADFWVRGLQKLIINKGECEKKVTNTLDLLRIFLGKRELFFSWAQSTYVGRGTSVVVSGLVRAIQLMAWIAHVLHI